MRFVGKVLGELRTRVGDGPFAKGSNDSFVAHGKSLSTNKSLQSVALYKYIRTRTCKVIAKSDDDRRDDKISYTPDEFNLKDRRISAYLNYNKSRFVTYRDICKCIRAFK